MTCPYCRGEMLRGKVLGDRSRLHWVDYDAPSFLGAIISRYLHLGEWQFFGRPFCEAYYCPTCRKIIIDSPEISGFYKE